MKILVTGGAGFIGSHIVDRYVALGHKVTVVDDLSSGRRSHLNPKARFFRLDVSAPAFLKRLKAKKFDVVNHHAAQIDVRRSVSDPAFDARVNVMGLLNVLELCRQNRVGKVIFSASGGTYYGECGRPARETDRPNPLSPYGVTKLASEFYLRAYRSLHGLKHTILRYGNVYGPRQDPHGEAGVVAIFCTRMVLDRPINIYGDGEQQRDYVFVKDVAQANVQALRRGEGEPFNIGTQNPLTVNRLFKILQKVSGYQRRPDYPPPRTGELFRSVLDVSKARAELGWRPRTPAEEGLRETYLFIRGQLLGTR